MEKAFVAQRVAKKLFVTEAAVDGALVEATELMGEMLRARQDVNVSMVFADDVQVKMMEAMKALSEARTAMVAVHSELNEAKLRLGIRTKMEIIKTSVSGELHPESCGKSANNRLNPNPSLTNLLHPLGSIRSANHVIRDRHHITWGSFASRYASSR